MRISDWSSDVCSSDRQLQDVERRSADGRTPGQQLSEISDAAAALMAEIQTVWHAIRRELAGEGIEMLDIERIPAEQVEWLEVHFRAQVFPIVTPQALDPAHPFPFIPNRGSGVMFDLVRLSDSEPVRELVMLRSEEHTSELQSLMR